jgi:hypothetical protein
MPYTSAEARQELLDALAAVTDDIGVALGALGDAYEQLDEATADHLEELLFAPVQAAYGRAKRTQGEFADRHGMARPESATPAPGAPSRGVRAFVDAAVDAVQRADTSLAALQDSLMPVEVGDAELRAGMAEVRRQLAGVPASAREFVRRLGR